MAFIPETLFDVLSNKLAPVMRTLQDKITLKLMSSKVNLLRITKTQDDELGDSELSLQTNVISNILIKYPYNKMEIFSSKTVDNKFQGEALDIIDILPIEIILQFQGTYDTDPIVVQAGDILVDTLFDENDNIIPIILQVTRLRGSFFGKFIVQKTAECSLTRGELEDDIQAEVNSYLNTLST